MPMKKDVTIILGPTGTGKSRLGISLAKKHNGVILSADSRQVFRYADIGTNKYPLNKEEIDKLERHEGKWVVNGVDIYGYDVVDPDESFSVADFIHFAMNVFDKVEEDTPLIVIGGTGFYIDALLGLRPYSTVKPNDELRNELGQLSAQELLAKLGDIDPQIVAQMNFSDQSNPQRLIRYIELADAKGTVKRAKEFSPLKDNLIYQKIGLTTKRELLDDRVKRWVEHIMEGNLAEETDMLISKGYRNTPLMKGLIYSAMVDTLDGLIDPDETHGVITKQVQQYIRRQLTWFNKDTDTRWFDITDKDFDRRVAELLESKYTLA